LSKESAEQEILAGNADAAAWGQWLIANPDLVQRFRQHTRLNEIRTELFYGGGAAGYTDYPMA
jgi:2,4-dienoyl-CoA reductase-like NADH-dependent reductase (Old Yellow Enzyme family)